MFNFGDSTGVVWFYSLVSVAIVSLISLIGTLTFSLKEEDLKRMLLYLVSFSAGGLFGDAFIHLIPEAMEDSSFRIHASLLIIFGIFFSFALERFLQWRHCHILTSHEHPHPFAYMNLLGDTVHNFIDGLVIGGSYLVSIPLGVASTLAVVFHEIPQEIGDFGVLIYGRFPKSKALFFNFLTALAAILGAILALSFGFLVKGSIPILIPFAAGNFIYIAGSDLIPEIRREQPETLKSALQLTAIALGILIMFLLVFLE